MPLALICRLGKRRNKALCGEENPIVLKSAFRECGFQRVFGKGSFSLSTFSPLPGGGVGVGREKQFKGATFKIRLNRVKPIAFEGRHALQGLLPSRRGYMPEVKAGVFGSCS